MAASGDVHASWVDKEASTAEGTHPDIKLLVDHYRNIGVLHGIAVDALRTAQDLILWKSKLFSVLSMLVVCVVCVLPELFLMLCLQACVVVMLLGRWYGRIAPKREEKRGGNHDDDTPDVEADMAEFVKIMHQVQVLLVKSSQVLDELKSIANWTRPTLSLCVTLYLCLQAGVLVFLGARWFLPLLPLAVYCFNSGFRQAFQSKNPRAVVDEWKSPPNGSSPSQDPQDVVTSSTSPSPSCNLDMHQIRSDNFGFQQVQQRGRARGRGRTPPGNCTDCKASFAKLLKRKHRCNSCGLDFCGNCTVKVKKFLLGVTSPAAYEDSVRVCVACCEQLKAMDSELSSFVSQRTATAEGSTPTPTLRQRRPNTHRSSPRPEQPSADTALCMACCLKPILHSCNSCGLDICGECVVEVKKFLLGATSPAAYEESVRVCVACSEQLKAMDLELSSLASQRSATPEGPTTADPDTRRSPRAEQPSADTAPSKQP